MIKGILIDLDNTLYSYETAHNKAMEAVYNYLSKDYSKEEIEKNFNIAREQIHNELKNTASSHNRLLYFQRMNELLGNENILCAKVLYKIYWNNFIDNMTLYDGVREFLKTNQDKKICLVTDLTAYIQYRKIEKLNLEKYIKFLVTSEEAGVEKPGRKIFELALKKLKLNAHEVCMIGDSYEKDIKGAINMGIKPIYKTNNKNIKDVITFNDFKELREIINE